MDQEHAVQEVERGNDEEVIGAGAATAEQALETGDETYGDWSSLASGRRVACRRYRR
jgi:hypothetical protein